MPDPAARDYTTRELTEAARALGEAADVLTPAADVLMGTADDLMRSAPEEPAETDHGDRAVHIARTARHLTAIALHLRSGEITLRRLATTGTGQSATERVDADPADEPGLGPYWSLQIIVNATIAATAVWGLLAGGLPPWASATWHMLVGFGSGAATVNLIHQRRTRRARPGTSLR